MDGSWDELAAVLGDETLSAIAQVYSKYGVQFRELIERALGEERTRPM